MAGKITGATGDTCMPKCADGTCPTDYPAGDTATGQCVVKDPSGNKYCILVCKGMGTGTCPDGATCSDVSSAPGVGICLYPAGTKASVLLGARYTFLPNTTPIPEKKPEVLKVNPTHYGDPAGGCEDDEMSAKIQGLKGDCCVPKCTGAIIKDKCPTDVPDGTTAKPECVL